MIEYFNEDCMAGMARYPDKHFDLAIVDPPYGVSIENSGTYFRQFSNKGWDVKPPDEEYFAELRRVSVNQIIWGGNYFLEHLGNTKCFVIWDKLMGEGMSFADAELAWTSLNKPTRIKRMVSRSEGKIHPTQKPIALYKWLLSNYAKPGDKILDTHVGSASSLIACHDLGFDAVGFELDEDYYRESKQRLERFMKQITLFDILELEK